ncbi:MAG: heparinase, partial [Phocaeicola sp.]|nr:heparinase [Phocaeicola sp.]
MLFTLLLLCSSAMLIAQDMFEYTLIGDHPRLFMRANDFTNLEKQISKSPEIKTIHDIILNKCDNIYLKAPVLEHKLDESGRRLLHVSRTALEQIFCLSYAYRMTGEKKYLQKAEAQMQTVCDFKDWNPTHYLDVGEMALAVAIGYDWLYADLQPKTRDLAVKAIATHAFGTSDVLKYAGFFKNSNNWNQVCNGGLVSAAIA